MYNTDLPLRAELPSSAKLLKSAAMAAISAVVILIAFVLPAEYGLDPTGVGRLLGLTEMGEIKAKLVQESAQDAAAPVKPTPSAQAAQPVAQTVPPKPPLPASAPVQANVATADVVGRNDELKITLPPGQAAEVKLSMKEGASIQFEWAAQGGRLNFDAHGDPVNPPKGFYHGYVKGRNSSGERGELKAAFDGTHGWYWRNRSEGSVTLILKTRGAYSDIKRVI